MKNQQNSNKFKSDIKDCIEKPYIDRQNMECDKSMYKM